MTNDRVYLCLALVLLACWLPKESRGAPLVGAYYYPWYGTFSGAHDWQDSLRQDLIPAQPPALGLYDSRDSALISAHIDASHRGNIDFWAVSWWGPQSPENTTFLSSILTNPRRAEMRYAVNYESAGRLGAVDAPNYSNLVADFRYLANNYFGDPNYLQIGGRPVVYMYLTRDYFNSQAGRDAVAGLRATLQSEFNLNPYIIGDDLFNGPVDAQRAQLWDAITDFDVYGTSLQSGGSTSAALSDLANVYDAARNALANLNVGFVPTASPGFNDTAVRGGHPPAPRYMTDNPNSREGDLFARMLSEVAVPRIDPKAGNILMINSFNEWHEDTQIEATISALQTNLDGAGSASTGGFFYQGYGDTYLDILHAATVPEPASATLSILALLMILPLLRISKRRNAKHGG